MVYLFYISGPGRGVSKSTGPAKFSLALALWPWSFISPDYVADVNNVERGAWGDGEPGCQARPLTGED